MRSHFKAEATNREGGGEGEQIACKIDMRPTQRTSNVETGLTTAVHTCIPTKDHDDVNEPINVNKYKNAFICIWEGRWGTIMACPFAQIAQHAHTNLKDMFLT